MYAERLKQLREKMAAANIDYYYVPAADTHRNEYVPDCWQRRAWITGFTGSAGDALIGKKNAYLWTDGRYFLQAEQQLDPHYFQLMKQQPGAPSLIEWLITQSKSLRVGVDPQLLTIEQQQKWSVALQTTRSKLVAIAQNWIDELWLDQPPIPHSSVFPLANQYTGRDVQEKLSDIRQALMKQNADALVITRLDAIAWLFNIRGNDILYNPLAISYAIVTSDTATLFIDNDKITAEDKHYFQSQQIALKSYTAFGNALNQLKTTVLLDPRSSSWWTHNQLNNAKIIFAPSPITLFKAIKNLTEQNGMREAHRIDAIAMVKFLHWLENHWQTGITEITAADQLETFRRADPRCKDLSFATISGFASNGAIIHYSPTKTSNKTIDDSAPYLVDSGGQYFEGTTDVTRTIHLGNPTATEKRHYTLVLKGHIALRHATFTPGTFGEALDPYARKPLQQAGYDYAHGTGHGVGCYLCVHEGPQMISPRKTGVALQPGMVVSNEPGLYIEGHYGIRIENVCLIVEVGSKTYGLEDLTLVPYARNLIDKSELSAEEIKAIDDYHQTIYNRLASDLPSEVSQWLKTATEPLSL